MPRNVCVNVLGEDEHVLARLGSQQFGRFLKSISKSRDQYGSIHFLRICLIYEFENIGAKLMSKLGYIYGST